jgi:hypothetical protein
MTLRFILRALQFARTLGLHGARRESDPDPAEACQTPDVALVVADKARPVYWAIAQRSAPQR